MKRSEFVKALFSLLMEEKSGDQINRDEKVIAFRGSIAATSTKDYMNLRKELIASLENHLDVFYGDLMKLDWDCPEELKASADVPSFAAINQSWEPVFQQTIEEYIQKHPADDENAPTKDFSGMKPTEDISITSSLWKEIRQRLGNARGRPGPAELHIREDASEKLTEYLEASEQASFTQEDIHMAMMKVLDELMTESYIKSVEALTAKKAKTAVKKRIQEESDDGEEDDAAAPKKGKKEKMKSRPDEKFISFPASLMTAESIITTSLSKLTRKDLMAIFSKELPSKVEVRYLVDTYYQMQQMRIALAGQRRAALQLGEPFHTIEFFFNEFDGIEGQIKTALDAYTEFNPIGWTLKQICGVGPVISAGLIANFDITKAKTANSFLRYCGLDPTLPPKTKGVKLQYNAPLKTLVVFKLGESFIKVSNHDDDIYGKHYKKWKELYTQRSESGFYKEHALARLQNTNWKKTDGNNSMTAYKEGKLPLAEIHNRARRKPVSLFICHLFELMYRVQYHCIEPNPYIFEYGEKNPDGVPKQHVDYVPNPLIPIYENRYGKIPLDQPAPHTLIKDSRFTAPISQMGMVQDKGE